MGKTRRAGASGFTLIEMSITVVIISILAALAIPSYEAYRRNSYRYQMKADLAAAYTAERVFNSEWGTYSARFDAIGYLPHGESHFAMAINYDRTVLPTGAPPGTATCNMICGYYGSTCPMITFKCNPEAMHGGDPGVNSFASATNFLVEAHTHWMNIQAGAETWTIDDTRAITGSNNPQ